MGGEREKWSGREWEGKEGRKGRMEGGRKGGNAIGEWSSSLTWYREDNKYPLNKTNQMNEWIHHPFVIMNTPSQDNHISFCMQAIPQWAVHPFKCSGDFSYLKKKKEKAQHKILKSKCICFQVPFQVTNSWPLNQCLHSGPWTGKLPLPIVEHSTELSTNRSLLVCRIG